MFLAAPPTPPPPWVNFTALWQIVVLGLIAGAGLPALFAIGLRALAMQGGRTQVTAGAPAPAGADEATADGRAEPAAASGRLVGGNPAGLVLGGLCFLIVLAAIGWSIWAIYESGHPS
jgi:hypothetical protein